MNYVDNPFQSPAVLSLCTGMRGLERGLERAIGGIRVAAYVEIEAFIIYNLVRQMEQGVVDAAPVWTDIKTFPSQQFHGKIHWIIGGYPCQPFSVAGLQNGINDPRHLWPFIRKSIEVIQPFGCFFENVANHLNIGYREVRRDLEEMGYKVKEGIFSAEEVGAPHERKRLFILAMENTFCAGIRNKTGNANRQNWWENVQQGYWKAGTIWPESAGKELGNSESISEREQNSEDGTESPERKTRTGISSAGEELAHSYSERLEKGWLLTGGSEQTFSRSGCDAYNCWPAGQGNYQHEWEEPRTIEPGMGCSVDGYNFREDLLRMYGNGVVEQTAELAFIDLLNKHINQSQKV